MFTVALCPPPLIFLYKHSVETRLRAFHRPHTSRVQKSDCLLGLVSLNVHPWLQHNIHFILLLFPAKELCSSKCIVFCKANHPESWMPSSCTDLILNPQKKLKRHSECKANSNYPDNFLISAMNCSCICSWAGELFSLKPWGEEDRNPRISLPGGIPTAHTFGCELSPLLEKSLNLFLLLLDTAGQDNLHCLETRKQSLCPTDFAQLLFSKKPQPQLSSRGLSHSFNFLIHVKPNRRKIEQKVHSVKL